MGSCFARVGLLGNPSDGYGGRVIAMTVPQLQTTVSVTPADTWGFADTELLEATVAALHERRPELVDRPGAFTFETTIPRQVGLAGSSAIIMAALRALATRAGSSWDLVELARTTLEVETQVLRWAAGPQDRVVQAFAGLVDMDFATPWQASSYQRLDATNLPSLFVAWHRSTGAASNVAHTDVRQRWLDGEPVVCAAMTRFAELAVRGRHALDHSTARLEWPALMNEAFELRCQIWNITDVDTALVDAGRAIGAGVAFAGSGGAVVGSLADPELIPVAAQAYDDIDAGFLVLHP